MKEFSQSIWTQCEVFVSTPASGSSGLPDLMSVTNNVLKTMSSYYEDHKLELLDKTKNKAIGMLPPRTVIGFTNPTKVVEIHYKSEFPYNYMAHVLVNMLKNIGGNPLFMATFLETLIPMSDDPGKVSAGYTYFKNTGKELPGVDLVNGLAVYTETVNQAVEYSYRLTPTMQLLDIQNSRHNKNMLPLRYFDTRTYVMFENPDLEDIDPNILISGMPVHYN